MFDATFDLSVFDLFVAWTAGASVCCPPATALLNPDAFIRDNALTVWFSVPSVAAFMTRLGVLKDGRYPSLRWSLFCGEPLPAELATRWSKAAPASRVENLYGPTELTVACCAHRWDPRAPAAGESTDIVPIGRPLPGLQALVVDGDLHEVAPGAVGELLVAGPQVTPGYWRNPDATRAAYVTPNGHGTVFYRTGDRVRRPAGADPLEPLRYVGRVDQQIKVLGHRVELGEVESALRADERVSEAVALGWPATASGADAVVAFVTGPGTGAIDVDALRRAVERTLPSYAVPRDIRVVGDLPLNANGKVDRGALRAWLEA